MNDSSEKRTKTHKPNTRTAMQQLIDQVRVAMPFGLSVEDLCGDTCQGCSNKLLIYLETELDAWEVRLADGVVPTLGDLDRVAKQCKKIYRVLQQNGLLNDRATP